jgi:outer membrane protein TolC
MPKLRALSVALALLLTHPAWATEDQVPLTLKQAEKIALEENPALAASQAQAQALAEVPPQAGSLPDPQLSLNAMNLPVDTFSATQENMTQLQVGISQAIPFPGKLRLREEAARHLAESATFEIEETRLRLIRNVRIAWWNLFYLDRALEIINRNQELLRQFIRIAETKYKVGKGLQQDVLLAQVELSKLLDIEIQLKGARKSEEARLNALLNRPTHIGIRLPAKVEEALPNIPEESELHRIALNARPLLASQNEIIKAADRRVELARKDYYPDFKLGAGYGFRSGINPANNRSRPDFASFMLSMNLPIFTDTKQDRALAQRKAELVREQFRLQDTTESVWSEASTAIADYRRSRDQALLFKTGIIPQASQTVDSMLAGYQVNKVDFLNLVNSQITLYNYETQYWKSLAEARQSLARLEASIGKEITDE